MNDKLSDQVSQLLEKLGGNAERVWPEMVAAVRFDGIMHVGVGVFCLMLAFGFLVFLYRVLSKPEHDPDDDDIEVVLLFCGAAVAGGVGVIMVLTSMTAVLYPEAALVAKLLK